MSDLTTDEAAAFRAGAEAMREACAKWHDAKAAEHEANAHAPWEPGVGDREEEIAYSHAHAASARDIRALQLPEPPPFVTGLEERGA